MSIHSAFNMPGKRIVNTRRLLIGKNIIVSLCPRSLYLASFSLVSPYTFIVLRHYVIIGRRDDNAMMSKARSLPNSSKIGIGIL